MKSVLKMMVAVVAGIYVYEYIKTVTTSKE